ncbi:MAG: M55 family metallopeptidase [Candidatus Omnitrophota bacterium]
MKIYLHTDIEGIAGYVFHEDRLWGERARLDHAYRMRKLLTAEVNAALEALVESGANEVVVNDAHGGGYNLIFEDLHPVADVIHGNGTRMPMWLPCIDGTFDAMICIGQHAMEGTKGILPHSRFEVGYGKNQRIALNETGLAMALAGTFGVPTILATGDTTLCSQVKTYVSEVEAVAVKEALSPYTAKTAVPVKAQQMIKEGVKRALARRKEIKPYVIAPPPYRITLFCSTPGFEKESEVFEDNESFWDLIKKAFSTIYDYELYDAAVWPLVPRGEPILNKHERAYKKRLEKEGKPYTFL